MAPAAFPELLLMQSRIFLCHYKDYPVFNWDMSAITLEPFRLKVFELDQEIKMCTYTTATDRRPSKKNLN